MPQRPAVRPAAVPAGGRAHARVRHHGPRQPGARLALYDGRLFRRHVRGAHRQLRPRERPRPPRHLGARHPRRDRGAAPPLRARPPRSRARHLRADPVLQRAGQYRVGAGRIEPAAARLAGHLGRTDPRRLLPDLPSRHHRDGACGRRVPLPGGDAHARRHAEPRRRLEPRDGRRPRDRHQAAPRPGFRAGCRARRPRRADAGADPHRADRHGREHPHPRLRGDRHRRHRFDPRRVHRRGVRRPRRHGRPRLPARSAAARALDERSLDRGARALLDADLSVDGDRTGGATRRPGFRSRPVSGALPHPRALVVAGVIAMLALLPLYTQATGNAFALTLFTRIVILALAASSLNLILGYGGMMSFGHAAYLGIGGYAIGILADAGVTSGFVQWPVALGISALFALAIGALSLRTRGVYFIMITLAFAQMIYYVASGLDAYGGDDGLTIYARSSFGGLINLSNKVQFYYFCLVLLLACLYGLWRLPNARFGLVIQGALLNERRMRAIGFPTYRYKLACFVIAGTLCGLAGALLANHTDFVSPAMMHWTRSGDLIVMVVLGGMGSLFGPLLGAVALVVLEEALSRVTEHWQIILGPLLLLVVLFARGGIDGAEQRAEQRAPDAQHHHSSE